MTTQAKEPQSNSKWKILSLSLAGVLCIAVVAFMLLYKPAEPASAAVGGIGITIDPGAEDWQGELPTERVGEEVELQASLQLPGYTALDFVAGATEQAVNFMNPKENPCYITIGLSIDGERIYTSGLIPPGKGLYSIELERALEQGQYNGAMLHYRCFSLEDGETEYNGANMELELRVN